MARIEIYSSITQRMFEASQITEQEIESQLIQEISQAYSNGDILQFFNHWQQIFINAGDNALEIEDMFKGIEALLNSKLIVYQAHLENPQVHKQAPQITEDDFRPFLEKAKRIMVQSQTQLQPNSRKTLLH